MEISELKGLLEGLLFACGDEGATIKQLANVMDVTTSSVEHLLEELKYDYEHTERGMMVIQSNGIYHLTTKPEHSHYFKKLLETPQANRLSQAGLETLAIIAYEQPITRVEIEEIRGVNSDRPVQTLLAKSLIEEVGRRDGVGRPVLFGTGKDFLTYFGLTSLNELPPLPENTENQSLEQEADLFFDRFQEMEEDNNRS
ncbi:SMC-Scp complex subunit ScpB [Virgibacillus sp. W0181]|uniref:SMC-Scp complex subunit ScpB n=1 Tax=Virgibacillus sp. W0181 TaxID=3391581 RepID=UPI003F488DFA